MERNKAVAPLGLVGDSHEERVLLELVREGRVAWSGGKPEGARRAAAVTGATVADAVIQDRR